MKLATMAVALSFTLSAQAGVEILHTGQDQKQGDQYMAAVRLGDGSRTHLPRATDGRPVWTGDLTAYGNWRSWLSDNQVGYLTQFGGEYQYHNGKLMHQDAVIVAQRAETDERNRQYDAEMDRQRQSNGGLTNEQLDKLGMEKGLAWLRESRSSQSATQSASRPVEIRPIQ
jgi:hypothetical protein